MPGASVPGDGGSPTFASQRPLVSDVVIAETLDQVRDATGLVEVGDEPLADLATKRSLDRLPLLPVSDRIELEDWSATEYYQLSLC